MTAETFISRARAIHGDRYDYRGTRYVVMTAKVEIACRQHGAFAQAPQSHLQGSGCPTCRYIQSGGKRRLDTPTFLARAHAVHGDRFDYSRVNYAGWFTNVTIVCLSHGAFTSTPANHVSGRGGCMPCANATRGVARRVSREEMIKRAISKHGKGRYDYSLVEEFTRTVQPVTIICPLHGPFMQSMAHHCRGDGCPSCNESHGEREVEATLSAMGQQFVRQFNHRDLKFVRALSLDFAIPGLRIAIEFDGEQHARPVRFHGIQAERAQAIHEAAKLRDAAKDRWAAEHGWRIIRLTREDNVRAVLAGELGFVGDLPTMAFPPASMAWMPGRNAHALVGGARPIMEDGSQSANTAGPGRALCTCTEKSSVLATGRLRRAWNREHREATAVAQGLEIDRAVPVPRNRRLRVPARAGGRTALSAVSWNSSILFDGYRMTEFSGYVGDDADAFTATLTRDGSPVGTVSNSGRGGANTYQFADPSRAADFEAYASEIAAGSADATDSLTDRLVMVVMLDRSRVVPILFAGEDIFAEGRYRAFGSAVSMSDTVEMLAGRPGARVWVKGRSAFVLVTDLLAA